MMFPLVRELAADGVPVVVSCRVLKLCRAQYYRWLDTPIGDRELAQAYVANAVCDAHVDGPEFGYRFLADEARAAGYPVSDRTVWARCSENGWWASFTKPRNRKAEQAKRAVPAHDDLVRRAFGAEGPDELWVSDITEHPTGEGKLYVCVVKDMWSQRVIGWAISDRMKAGLVVAAINTAAARRGRPVDGCTFHSDRGSQYRSRKVRQALRRHRLVGSMGQVGTAADNAAAESFFSLLQKNVLNTRRWDTRDELRIAVIVWIERTYHHRRRQDRLGRLTPIEYETIMNPTALRAA